MEPLALGFKRVRDVGARATLKRHGKLDVHADGIRDATPLGRISSLEEPDLRGNRIRHPGPLSPLPALRKIASAHNPIDSENPRNRAVLEVWRSRGVEVKWRGCGQN